jgi:hypothetical protein
MDGISFLRKRAKKGKKSGVGK